MAIISSLIGGLTGFVAFLSALVFSNATILQALQLYILTGLTAMVALMAFGMILRVVADKGMRSEETRFSTDDTAAGSSATA